MHTRRLLICLLGLALVASVKVDAPINGDLLSVMEWSPGVEDSASAGPKILDWDSESRPPSRVFGLKSSELPSPRPQATLQDEAKLLGAALVRAYEEHSDPANTGFRPLVRQYLRFLKTNRVFSKRMAKLFSLLDTNSDGYLDDFELSKSVARGYLSKIGRRAVETWDVNYNRRVSWREFELGPMFLVLLQGNATVFQHFRRNAPGNADEATLQYRSELGPYFTAHPAALGLLEISSKISRYSSFASPSPSSAALGSAAAAAAATSDAEDYRISAEGETQAEKDAMRATFDRKLAEARRDPDIEQDFEPAFAELQSRTRASGKAHGKAAAQTKADVELGARALLGLTSGQKQQTGFGLSATMEDASRRKRKGLDTRPKSKYGIPTSWDELCVTCQYIAERVLKELELRIIDDYTVFDAQPFQLSTGTGEAYPSLAQMTGRSNSLRPSFDLFSGRGQRSPARMVTQVVTFTMRRVCSDSAPFLFRGHCQNIWNRRWDLAYGLYRRLGAAGSCLESNLCGPLSYMFWKYTVHLPRMSNLYNSGQGMCGLLGGPKARHLPGVSEVLCFAERAATQISLLSSPGATNALNG